MSHDPTLEPAERWLAHDPDPATRAELQRLLDAARAGDAEARADLHERFSGPLEFGTAGLRGLLGAGESRMNRAVARRTTAGLAAYLLDIFGNEARTSGVAIGYDARRLSREMAEDTARVFISAGIPAYLATALCPTPITAFAVQHLGTIAGVMVTASHNPPAYNGYKVYWGNGAQIIPPHDTGIAAAIHAAPPADEIPCAPVDEARARGDLRDFPPTLERAYLDAIRALSPRKDGDRTLPIVYTPLHGVGDRLVHQALAEAGFTRVVSVPEQAAPDGAFATVSFPNPEEKGALDLALALAQREEAPLLLASDPDVDRLAAAVRRADGTYQQLTGNQVGTLLGHYLLTAPSTASGEDRLVIATCVSSPQLGAIARALGVRYEETLTGFKWIANRALDLERDTGARFVFGYEEALGYCAGTVVRDKDGISAAVLLAELAAVLRAEGLTLLDALDRIARTYGLFVSAQRNFTFPGTEGMALIDAAMDRLRRKPPRVIADVPVAAHVDVLEGLRVRSDGTQESLTLPSSNVLIYELEGGSRVIARPSGTEPKIKFYLDVREPVAEGEPLAEAEARARARMEALGTAFCGLAGMG
ncbi:phospho-sugar mutase [Chondromyces apiculatus]|uniref:Phosphomannomutase n=1 Tax=Chondromyces apiculatus DSM 436 TaxID=1192034 RepID=A0A017T2D7_9BACT|nr:phospho-sugar mutase [Chondromyces apiculatus]EYF03403.1 Hypothetical protein CAP_5596 [Chondromyces apiculatus DSM 436]